VGRRGDGGRCYRSGCKGNGTGQPGALKWEERLQPPLTGPLASTCFGFEADFTSDLRCIPMAVRRKLDLAGVKLKLQHWSELEEAERSALLAWPDDPAAIEGLRQHLLKRTAALSNGPAKELPRAVNEPWQQSAAIPEVLSASCAQLGLQVHGGGWTQLDELQRFALVKLSHPGHEHRNLPRALAEFGLLEPHHLR